MLVSERPRVNVRTAIARLGPASGPVTVPLVSRIKLAALPLRWWILGGAIAALVALRWALRSQYLFDLDSILYARALDNFDLRLQQPPLPGYFLYIQLGRLVRVALVDANVTLDFISASFGALLAVALFALGRQLYDTRTGIVAALLGLTGPAYWYQSSFASPRIAEGFLATLIVWLGARYRRRHEAWAFWVLPIVVALAGGLRQQVLLYLIPFCVWCTWRTPLRLRVAAAALGSVVLASWLIPTLIAAGGIDHYRDLSAEQWQAFVVNQTGVPYARDLNDLVRRLIENIGRIGVYLVFACPLGVVALAVTVRHRARLHDVLISQPSVVLVLAALPAILFFTFIHVQQIGHIMAVAPFFSLIVARALTRLPRTLWTSALICVIVGANLVFIFMMPARLLGDRIGTPTVAAIRERDQFISSMIDTVQAGSPGETLILASPLAYGFVEQYTSGYSYLLLPGLFETGSASLLSRDQRALTNGLQRLQPGYLPRPGTVVVDDDRRRFIMVGYDEDISRMIRGSALPIRPQASVPSLAIVETVGPTAISYGPQHLEFVPAMAARPTR